MSMPPPTLLRHVAISASAGSGKTFQLAHRYLRLIAGGVAPERICALTFSRKAAGEIFDEIVKYLVRAASDPRAAEATAAHGGFANPGVAAFLAMLRHFLDNLHRLNIGTLDSFMIGILRAFPAELGVSPGFSVMDGEGPAATELRTRVLRQLFSLGGAEPAARQAFLEAYKRATFGREEKAAFDQLDRVVTDHRALYREVPQGDAWGQSRAIWPRGPIWPRGTVDIEAVRSALLAHAVAVRWDAKVVSRWEAFLELACAFSAQGAWPRGLDYLLNRLVAALDDLQRGQADLTLDRKPCALDATACTLALDVMRHIINTELDSRLASTQGLHAVLASYEAAYDAWSRRAGTLSFSDAQYLLTAGNRHSGGLLLSSQPDTEGRLYIDYRLDARLDHWLLDEFQDTSDLQWAAIRNLVEELLQDPSGSRSFFYVGDVKQAIYGWRGGNPRLFGDILATYWTHIDAQSLSVSFRSCPAVLTCVNAIFDSLDSVGLPADTCAQWAQIWRSHSPSPGGAAQSGYAALLEPPNDGKHRTTDEERHALAAALLRDLDPIGRKLSVALLVRTNAQGRDLVDALRRECPGMPIVHEGHAPLRDNPVVALLLALVRMALHPGDLLAWRHLQMSPLAPALAETADPERLAEVLLRHMQARGFHDFIRHWGTRLDALHPLDPFGQRRLRDTMAAASEFDASASRDPAAFLRHLEAYQTAESATGQAVRVMTIHQSKGLGFDVVILPELQGQSMDKSHDVDIVRSRATDARQPEWVLQMPRRPVAEADTVLRQALRREDAHASFGELCVLYVALTRAKRAMYLITGFAGPSAEALSPAALLKHQLTGAADTRTGPPLTIAGQQAQLLYETGQADWHHVLPTTAQPAAREPATATPVTAPPGPSARTSATPPLPAAPAERLVPVEPSAHATTILRPAARLFEREARDVLTFGTEIHALFERLTWLDETDPDRVLEDWLQTTPATGDIRRDVANQFRRCLQDPAVRALVTRPTEPTRLWRELRFDMVLDGNQWVRGVFDRVELRLDAAGRPVQAWVTDYKSDRLSDAADFVRARDTHRPQLELYGRVLAQLLPLPPEAIGLRLVFTRAPRVEVL